jgi:hypothetical protein
VNRCTPAHDSHSTVSISSVPQAFGIQAVGGCGALRIGAELLVRHAQYTTFYISEPTWGELPEFDIFSRRVNISYLLRSGVFKTFRSYVTVAMFRLSNFL